jgi:hypothetical protein
MNRQTRRILKVYLKLEWVKFNSHYAKINSVAYAGAMVMNPFRKLPFLRRLWKQVPPDTADQWFDHYNENLKALWANRYKDKKLQKPSSTAAERVTTRDYFQQRLEFTNFLHL